MKRLDYLMDKHVKLYQDSEMFKFNSDTLNLLNFIELKKNNYEVLDVGTNNGVLLACLDYKKKGKFYYGVDINPRALEFAKENLELNGISTFQLYNEDFSTFKLGHQVDYIVSNPPYFDGENESENEDKRKARFTKYLPLENLISNARRLLKDEGSLFMVYPSFKLPQVIVMLDKYHFGVKRLQFVYDENKDKANVFLIEARKEMKHYSIIEKPIYNKR